MKVILSCKGCQSRDVNTELNRKFGTPLGRRYTSDFIWKPESMISESLALGHILSSTGFLSLLILSVEFKMLMFVQFS